MADPKNAIGPSGHALRDECELILHVSTTAAHGSPSGDRKEQGRVGAVTRNWLRLVRACALVLMWPVALPPASAQSVGPARETNEFAFTVTPYVFLPVVTSGRTAIGGSTTELDLKLGDVFELLNMGGSVRAEASKGKFSLIIDGYYANLGASEMIEVPDVGPTHVDFSSKQAWVALMGAYNIYEGAFQIKGAPRRISLDGGAGARFNNLRQEVELTSYPVDSPPAVQKLGGDETWWEPTVMLRASADLSQHWTAGIRAELGGFGSGGDDLQWNTLLGFAYRPTDRMALRVGWQLYGIDFSTTRSDGAFAYDVFQTGPYLAASVRF